MVLALVLSRREGLRVLGWAIAFFCVAVSWGILFAEVLGGDGAVFFVEAPSELCESLEGASPEEDWDCGAAWRKPSGVDDEMGETLYELAD